MNINNMDSHKYQKQKQPRDGLGFSCVKAISRQSVVMIMTIQSINEQIRPWRRAWRHKTWKFTEVWDYS